MTTVGIVSIAVGVVGLFFRGAFLVAPWAAVRWLERAIETNGRLRALGAFLLILGAAMAWAGASEGRVLATVLSLLGWLTIGSAALALVLFPGIYRAIAKAVLPSDSSGSLIGWRIRGLAGVVASVLFIYFGALAL